MPTIIDPVIRLFVDIGIVDVILPFVLVFTVVFAVLQQTKALGERKNVSIIIALVSGMIVVASVDMIGAVSRVSTFISIVLVTALLVMMLFGLVGVQSLEKSKPLMYVLLAILFFGTLYVLGILELVNRRSLLEYFLPAILVFAIFVALVYGVLKMLPGEKKQKEPSKATKPAAPKPEKATAKLTQKFNALPDELKAQIINSLPDDEKKAFVEGNAAVLKMHRERRSTPTPEEKKAIDKRDKIINDIMEELEE